MFQFCNLWRVGEVGEEGEGQLDTSGRAQVKLRHWPSWEPVDLHERAE